MDLRSGQLELKNDLTFFPYRASEISQAVDAPEDIPLIEELFAHDALINNYA